jgi:hypothetical protein
MTPVRLHFAPILRKRVDNRLKSGDSKAPARAVLAVLAVPQAGTQPLPTRVSVVEFYNASLDHYFITAIPNEISDLDNGVHAGWARTGETFNAYAIGSAGRTGPAAGVPRLWPTGSRIEFTFLFGEHR